MTMNRAASDVLDQGGRPPFFVVGSDRSGTTLLRLYLNAHPELAVPSESWFLIDLFERFGPTAQLEGGDIEAALAIVAEHSRFKDGWSVDMAWLRGELVPRAPLAMVEVVDALFKAETGIGAAGRWGDKTPEYASHIDALHACFPDAQFVHIVRDGRDVYLSLAAKRWADRGYTPYELGRYWRTVVSAAATAGERLGPDAYLEVRYEDLVLDTVATLQRVTAFLGVQYTPSLLSAHEDADGIITPKERDAGVHDKLSRPPRQDDVQRWRSSRDTLRVGLAAGTMADELTARGYQDAPTALAALVGRNLAAYHHLWMRYVAPRLRRLLRRARMT